MPLLVEGKLMIPDGKTVSHEPPLTVKSSPSHLLLPGLVQAGMDNINVNIQVHYKPTHWLQ